ncbi:MAG TPA: hypothetical protein VGR15_04620 [Bacteroidota bacterium]|jgi:putative Ca2+/H+ antiporter (TMEM165/GDT1 family)|nr:hypothetical protein [Bacteroidota bacterium]
MNSQTIVVMVGFITAGAALLTGVAIIAGIVLPQFVPDDYRIVFGLLFVIYGVYRSTFLWIKQRKAKVTDEE